MNLKTDVKPYVLIAFAVLIISFLLIVSLRSLLPLVAAIFIAALIDPLIEYAEKKTKLERGLITAVTLTAIFTSLGYILTLLVVRLTFELGKLVNTLPSYRFYYSVVIENIALHLIDVFERIPEDVLAFLNSNFNQIMTSMISSLSSYYSYIMNKISMLPNLFASILIFIIFTFLFSYFISKDKNKIIDTVKVLFPEAMQEKVKSFQIDILISFMRLIKAQIVLVIISTLITIAGFYILKVEYALSLGIFCGLLDMLPLVGPSLIFIPWIGFTVILGNVNYAIKVLILYIIVLGNRQVLQAKIVGHNLGIDPLLSLVSIYLGLEIFGFLGLFVGPLVIVIVRSLIHSGLIPPITKPKDQL